MSLAAMIRRMADAGATPEAIAIAVEAVEAEQRVGIERRAKDAAKTRLYRQRGGGGIPEDMRARVMVRDNGQCQECGTFDYPQIDHIHPVSKGGETIEENLQVLCRVCNARKRDRIRKEIRRYSAEVVRNPADQVPPKKETSPTPPKEKTTPSNSLSVGAREFAEFWSLFPNKVGKRDAEKAFANARSRAPLDAILDGLRRYAAKTDDRPWCNPATFLNQNRWEDQPATAPVRPHSTASPQRERTVSDVLREISSGTYKGPPGDSEHPTIDASFSRRN